MILKKKILRFNILKSKALIYTIIAFVFVIYFVYLTQISANLTKKFENQDRELAHSISILRDVDRLIKQNNDVSQAYFYRRDNSSIKSSF